MFTIVNNIDIVCGTLKCEDASICEKVAKCEKNQR